MRRGYALMSTLVFTTALTGVVGLSYQGLATNLRVQHVQQLRRVRDEGSMRATAQVMALLETGIPSTTSLVRTLEVSTSSGLRTYRVTLTSLGAGQWEVRVLPATSKDVINPLPTSFASASQATK
jgi:hypothetical protein